MTRILFVIDNLDVGGPQKSLLALLDKIDYSRISVDILSLHGKGKLSNNYNNHASILNPGELLEAFLLPANKPLWALKTFFKYKKFRLFGSGLHAMVKFALTKCNMNQERQKIWKKYHQIIPAIDNEYDLAFGILGLSTYCIVDIIKAKKKFHWIRSDPRFLKLDETIEMEYFRKIDGALSVSKECAAIFSKMYPFLADRIYVFYNYIPISFYTNYPVDTTIFNEEQNKTKLITVSRLAPHKGIELALETCKELASRNKSFVWYILGDGPLSEKYKDIVNKYSLSEYVRFLGFQYNTIGYISQADIFVHLSESEGKSNAVDETIYSCKPIVITNYPTVREQINDEVNGLICPFDTIIIADAIERIMQDDQLRRKLIDGCKHVNAQTMDANDFLLGLLNNK